MCPFSFGNDQNALHCQVQKPVQIKLYAVCAWRFLFDSFSHFIECGRISLASIQSTRLSFVVNAIRAWTIPFFQCSKKKWEKRRKKEQNSGQQFTWLYFMSFQTNEIASQMNQDNEWKINYPFNQNLYETVKFTKVRLEIRFNGSFCSLKHAYCLNAIALASL